jgi:hypothetical protein
MNPLDIPYHLLLPCLLSVVGLGLIVWKRKRLFGQKSVFWRAVVVFLSVYALIVGRAAYEDIWIQCEVNRLDLNHDGLFSSSEMTPEVQELLRMQTSDVGRNFSFVSGWVVAFVLAAMVYMLGRLWNKKKNQPTFKD